jgi:hypothetical protein
VNTPADTERQAILATAARHLAADGLLLAECHPPEWFDTAGAAAAATVGTVRIDLVDVRRDGDLLSATVRYASGDGLWTQTFTTRRFDEAALRRELRGAGLSFVRWLRDDRTWFAAQPAG